VSSWLNMKQQILQQHQQLLQDKIDVFRDMIAALTEDAQNDAKGSAGDKHETALSMMHIEQEKLNHKLKEILAQKAIIDKIDASANHTKIALGSLVQANGMLLFISAALPKITVDNKSIIAVSPQSPLGSKLMGNEVGFTFEINTTKYLIQSIE
jgi:transcription elongation GreA/GreB family factor